jgi:hypothetical protein
MIEDIIKDLEDLKKCKTKEQMILLIDQVIYSLEQCCNKPKKFDFTYLPRKEGN